ncbi:MAG: Lrp/AsnC family transcriptional regulator [Actinomycetota bacterium]
MKAYVLVQTATGFGPIASELQVIPGVSSAEDLRGPYDAIVVAGSDGRPLETVLSEIRRLPGVTRALPAPLGSSMVRPSDTEAA